MLFWIAFSALVSAAAAAVSSWSVKRLTDGAEDVPVWRVGLPACLTGVLAGAAAGWPGVSIETVAVSALVVVMMALAVTDRETTWVPEPLLFPFCALLGAHLFAGLELSMPAGAAAGLLAGGAVRGFDSLISPRLPTCPPPGDVIAFLAGPALLGVGGLLAGAMLSATAVLFLIREKPHLLWIFADREAAQRAHEDLGYAEESGPAVPLLAVLFPIYAAFHIIGLVVR